MTQAEKYRNLAANARNDANNAKTKETAARYRAEAIRYEKLAKLASFARLWVVGEH